MDQEVNQLAPLVLIKSILLWEDLQKPRDISFKTALKTLLDWGLFQKLSKRKMTFFSSIFLKSKKDGSYRFILNLKNLNKFIFTPHFHMEDYKTVLKLMFKNCFLLLWLKDAYYLIPIQKKRNTENT